VGPKTRKFLLQKRLDGLCDHGQAANYTPGQVVKFYLGSRVGSVSPSFFETVAEACASQWTGACGIELVQTYNEADADFVISFDAVGDDVFRFDGEGGTLAHADKTRITLDAEERWEKPHGVILHAVLLHEMGHVLGLGHGPPGSVMAPYYQSLRTLTAADKRAAQALYGPPLEDARPTTEVFASYFNTPLATPRLPPEYEV